MTRSPFVLFNAETLAVPVVVAVPHAGRAYPPSMPLLRVPVEKLRALEDRFADRLADRVIEAGVATIVAETPRLWIDLNRAETELDPAMVRGGIVTGGPLPPRVRGGLGLIPRRLSHIGEIWRAPLDADDVEARIKAHYRPWHETLAALLIATRDKFGGALLIDLHSMPPLEGAQPPDIVIGDRFGRSASPQLTAGAEAIVTGAGFKAAVNAPYAGGHALDRHARPAEGIHALQLEFDRRTYLDPALDQPGPGLARIQALVGELVARLGDELVAPRRLAAE
jgi:N-formylglutamate amidohydrolase